ncbi:MAG: roadblock/LC7 domain-containing protein [Candidatus Hodarchaeota archaeon]
MSKTPEKVEKILSDLMNEIPDIEGLVLSKDDGSLIVSQTIFPDLDDKAISKTAVDVAQAAVRLSGTIEKGETKELNVEFNEGFCLITSMNNLVLTLITAIDARSQLGFIKMNAIKALNTINQELES